MNRRLKWIAGVLVIALSLLALLFVRHRDEVDWLSLSKVVGLITVLYLLLRFMSGIRYRRLEKMIVEGDADTALLQAKYMFRLNFFPTVKDQMLCLKLALLALKEGDRKHFLRYINQLEHSQLLFHKFFWRAILHFHEQNMERLNRNVASFLALKPTMAEDALYLTYERILQLLLDLDEPANAMFEGDLKERLSAIHPVAFSIISESLALKKLRKVKTGDMALQE
ncbi:MAG TPA: hypothetical protein VIK63_00800 [Haloplasmataceae bacterium]